MYIASFSHHVSNSMMRYLGVFAAGAAVLALAAVAVPTEQSAALVSDSHRYFTAAAYYALEAYCQPQKGQTVLGASIVAAGGDGGLTPYWYVAYQAKTNQIIVAHEGADFTKLGSLINAVEGFLIPNATDARLAPTFDTSQVLVASGFQAAWARSAEDVRTAVAQLKTAHKRAKIYVVGHSLGASSSTFSTAFLTNIYGRDQVFGYSFAPPAIGNKQYIDDVASKLNRVAMYNGGDPTGHVQFNPIYRQTGGHVHIEPANGNSSYWCPGEANLDSNCYYAPSHLPTYYLNIPAHAGTYFDVLIDSTSCGHIPDQIADLAATFPPFAVDPNRR